MDATQSLLHGGAEHATLETRTLKAAAVAWVCIPKLTPTWDPQCGVFRDGTRDGRHYSVGRALRYIERKALVQSLASGKLVMVVHASNCSTLESGKEGQKFKVNTSSCEGSIGCMRVSQYIYDMV